MTESKPDEVSRGTAPRPPILLSTRGRGKEIADRLRAELGIPPDVRAFSVAFRVDEAVIVTVESAGRDYGG